jgi:hypothetical protein
MKCITVFLAAIYELPGGSLSLLCTFLLYQCMGMAATEFMPAWLVHRPGCLT